MNKRYDFTQTGGFPLDQGVLNDEQNDMIAIETALGNLVGPLVIISGCVVAGANAGNGVVMINGQLLPFVGGAISAKVIIYETDTELNYFDGTPRPSLITRVAKFGDDGIQNNPWASFVRVSQEGILADANALTTRVATIESTYWQAGDIKEIDCTMAYIAANFDATGLGKNSRLGWARCNGQNGTKFRNGKVSVALDENQVEFATMGQTGGEKVHQLIQGELPSYDIQIGLDIKHDNGGPAGVAVLSEQNPGPNGNGSINIAVGGSDEAHNNLQEYIVTLFIQKL